MTTRSEPTRIRVATLADEEFRARVAPVLAAFEARYGLPSSRLAEAFRDEAGELVETDDFSAWDEAYSIWRWAAGPER